MNYYFNILRQRIFALQKRLLLQASKILFYSSMLAYCFLFGNFHGIDNSKVISVQITFAGR